VHFQLAGLRKLYALSLRVAQDCPLRKRASAKQQRREAQHEQ
jgi:hypothetical protein